LIQPVFARHSRESGNPWTLFFVSVSPGSMAMDKQPCVYNLASSRNGTLYIGVTSDLLTRTWQHREHVVDGFSKKYDVTNLVWYEPHGTMESAIQREKQIKKWRRDWKLKLIDEFNSSWRDLWPDIAGLEPKGNVHGFPLSRE
jgi:putative endonuclease